MHTLQSVTKFVEDSHSGRAFIRRWFWQLFTQELRCKSSNQLKMYQIYKKNKYKTCAHWKKTSWHEGWIQDIYIYIYIQSFTCCSSLHWDCMFCNSYAKLLYRTYIRINYSLQVAAFIKSKISTLICSSQRQSGLWWCMRYLECLINIPLQSQRINTDGTFRYSQSIQQSVCSARTAKSSIGAVWKSATVWIQSYQGC